MLPGEFYAPQREKRENHWHATLVYIPPSKIRRFHSVNIFPVLCQRSNRFQQLALIDLEVFSNTTSSRILEMIPLILNQVQRECFQVFPPLGLRLPRGKRAVVKGVPV